MEITQRQPSVDDLALSWGQVAWCCLHCLACYGAGQALWTILWAIWSRCHTRRPKRATGKLPSVSLLGNLEALLGHDKMKEQGSQTEKGEDYLPSSPKNRDMAAGPSSPKSRGLALETPRRAAPKSVTQRKDILLDMARRAQPVMHELGIRQQWPKLEVNERLESLQGNTDQIQGRSRACKHAEITKLARAIKGQGSILPLSKDLVESVAAALNESKMQSRAQYLLELKVMHIEAGYEIEAWLKRTLDLCKRALERQKGPTTRALESEGGRMVSGQTGLSLGGQRRAGDANGDVCVGYHLDAQGN
eukprot:s2029_g12.t1